jgi:hypothetical protein
MAELIVTSTVANVDTNSTVSSFEGLAEIIQVVVSKRIVSFLGGVSIVRCAP